MLKIASKVVQQGHVQVSQWKRSIPGSDGQLCLCQLWIIRPIEDVLRLLNMCIEAIIITRNNVSIKDTYHLVSSDVTKQFF